jgi:hypothetical protein
MARVQIEDARDRRAVKRGTCCPRQFWARVGTVQAWNPIRADSSSATLYSRPERLRRSGRRGGSGCMSRLRYLLLILSETTPYVDKSAHCPYSESSRTQLG